MIKGLQKTYEAAVTRVRDGRENEEHVDVATILHTWLDMAISPLLGEKKKWMYQRSFDGSIWQYSIPTNSPSTSTFFKAKSMRILMQNESFACFCIRNVARLSFGVLPPGTVTRERQKANLLAIRDFLTDFKGNTIRQYADLQLQGRRYFHLYTFQNDIGKQMLFSHIGKELRMKENIIRSMIECYPRQVLPMMERFCNTLFPIVDLLLERGMQMSFRSAWHGYVVS